MIYLGEKGINRTWQTAFPKVTRCVHCGAQARIGFVYCEDGSNSANKEFVCQLHETTGKEGGLWLHDAVATAVYFCEDCLEPTALYNQA